AKAAAVDTSLPRHVIDEQFSDRLLRPVRGLRRQRRIVGYRVGQLSAEHRERARKDEPGRLVQLATALEQCPCCVQVDPHAGVEFGFGLAAAAGGEMEYRN